MEEFVKFSEIEGSALVLVVLFEEFVEAAEVVCCLWEASLYALGNVSPFGEGEVHFFWVFAFFPGDGAEEGYEVLGDVVLDGCAVADGVDITHRCANDPQVGVCFQGEPVLLVVDFLGDLSAEFRLTWIWV